MAEHRVKGLTHISTDRQLFVDEYMVESTKHAAFTLNPATKYVGNPVIKRDRPWEGETLHYGSVIYDEQEKLFRMWYQSIEHSYTERVPKKSVPTVPGKKASRWCYAQSEDGMNWEKPALGFVEFDGSTDNNILGPDNWPSIKGGVFIDPHEKDPGKRFKALSQNQVWEEGMAPDEDGDRDVSELKPPPEASRFVWSLYHSGDALTWTPYEGNPVINRKKSLWGPTAYMGWDPIREVYAVYMENCINKYAYFGPPMCPPGVRSIGRAESPDLIDWSEPETIIMPGEEDPPDLEFYSMWTSAYEKLYIGMLWNFRLTSTTLMPQFVFSRDGVQFDRRYTQPFIQLGDEGSFDSVTVYAQQPIVHGDQIFIYYGGQNYRASEQMDKLYEEYGDDGPKGGIGLAVVPRDGFVSLDSGYKHYGEIVTRSFCFEGRSLQVSMRRAWRGWSSDYPDVRVELLAADHTPLEGYTFDDADNIGETGSEIVATWNGLGEIGHLAGRPIKLKFYCKNVKLFGFQFVE